MKPEKFTQLQEFIDTKQRTIGEVYNKMHELWHEDDPEHTKEFYEHATENQVFLYQH